MNQQTQQIYNQPRQKEDKYYEMLTFRIISSIIYLKQASIPTTCLGKNSGQNWNFCTIINKKLFYN